jgi:hypothetical protein
MSEIVSYTPFYYDPRGNRLERWEAASADSGHVLRLRGPIEVVEQVLAAAPEYQSSTYLGGTANKWTHELSSPDPTIRSEVRQLVELLSNVLTLPQLPPIKFAVALDWYKIPVDEVDSRSWPNTEVGDLVHKGKYVYKTHEDQKRVVGRNLAGRICNTISRHPVLDSAEVILNIPGHDQKMVSFGPRLAATVAKYRRRTYLKVTAKSEFRPEAKSLGRAQSAAVLEDEFIVPPEIRGRSALIVDDVFRSGGSMAAIARAASEAGVRVIYGICPTRTMRR